MQRAYVASHRVPVNLGLDTWRGEAVTDGYVVGNGQTLLLSGLPKALRFETGATMDGEPA